MLRNSKIFTKLRRFDFLFEANVVFSMLRNCTFQFVMLNLVYFVQFASSGQHRISIFSFLWDSLSSKEWHISFVCYSQLLHWNPDFDEGSLLFRFITTFWMTIDNYLPSVRVALCNNAYRELVFDYCYFLLTYWI